MTREAYMFLARHKKVCWDLIFGECRKENSCGFKHPEGGKEARLRELTAALGESGVIKSKKMWAAKETERQAARAAAGPSANNHEAKTPLPKGASAKASKQYKLTVAKGSAHRLRALRTREVGGSRGSTQVRRILRVQGQLPEVGGSQGPQGFSRWNDAAGEWVEDSEDEGADGAHGLPRQDSTNADDVPDLVEMPELGYDNDDEEMARVPQLSALDDDEDAVEGQRREVVLRRPVPELWMESIDIRDAYNRCTDGACP